MSGLDNPDKEPQLTAQQLAGMVEALETESVADVLKEHEVDPDQLRTIFLKTLLRTSVKPMHYKGLVRTRLDEGDLFPRTFFRNLIKRRPE
ncbi:hypothetical protein ACFLZH_01255 [Patescibacteria group bacterium]